MPGQGPIADKTNGIVFLANVTVCLQEGMSATCSHSLTFKMANTGLRRAIQAVEANPRVAKSE